MRDVLLLAFLAVSLAAALRYPFAGLLTWAWFSLMTPHQAAFDAASMPLNLVIAGVTIAGFVFSKQLFRSRIDILTALILLFMFWLTVSQQFSLVPENSAIYYDRMMKTLVFVLLCIQMTSTKLRFMALVWILVISFGFFAFKGAIFTIVTLGEFRVQGLPNTVIEDNNHFGIALATVLPLMLFLRGQSANKWVKRALLVLFVSGIISVIGTHSRGAFLCLIAFAGFFWWRSNHKFSLMAALMLLIIPMIAFMPAKYTDRMSTISEAGEDASFMGRVDAWVINTKLAIANPLTGAGLRNSYEKEVAAEVDRERSERAKAAHSIYFEILGGTGFVGLFIYLSLLGTAGILAIRVNLARKKKETPEWQWKYGYYAQMSLVVFAVGGASTSMEMWDGYLVVIALVAAAHRMLPQHIRKSGYALKNVRHTARHQHKGKPFTTDTDQLDISLTGSEN